MRELEINEKQYEDKEGKTKMAIFDILCLNLKINVLVF